MWGDVGCVCDTSICVGIAYAVYVYISRQWSISGRSVGISNSRAIDQIILCIDWIRCMHSQYRLARTWDWCQSAASPSPCISFVIFSFSSRLLRAYRLSRRRQTEKKYASTRMQRHRIGDDIKHNHHHMDFIFLCARPRSRVLCLLFPFFVCARSCNANERLLLFLAFCILFCCCCSRFARNRFRIAYLCTSLLCICVMSSWRRWRKDGRRDRERIRTKTLNYIFYYIIRMMLLLLLCDDIPSVDGISSILFCLVRYCTLILRSIWIFFCDRIDVRIKPTKFVSRISNILSVLNKGLDI